jgi:glycosyltransferase involved in cell wall biosynthesis
MTRLLLVTHYYAEHGGGVEIVAAKLAGHLARAGLDIVWVAAGTSGTPSMPGVSRHPIRAWNGLEARLGVPFPICGPITILRLARAVWRSDVVHLHDSLYLANFAAYLWARLFCKPIIVTQHIGPVPYSSRLLRWLLAFANHTIGRGVLGGCTQAVFISQKVRTYFCRFVRFRNEPLLIGNGVDWGVFHPVSQAKRDQLRVRLGWTESRPIMLFVGRFVEKKGLDILRKLCADFPDCTWVFAGWGPDNPAYWRLPNVRCLQKCSHAELADYYRAADLLVLPSAGEGFPLVLQEALACGTPVATSVDTASGWPAVESVAWTCEGYEQWRELIRLLSETPALLQARRRPSAEFARRNWDWETCAAQYLDVLTALAADNRPRRSYTTASTAHRNLAGRT